MIKFKISYGSPEERDQVRKITRYISKLLKVTKEPEFLENGEVSLKRIYINAEV